MNIINYIFNNNQIRKLQHLLTILNIKIKLPLNTKLTIEDVINENNLKYKVLEESLNSIKLKLSMVDNIWQNKYAKFYVPYYPIDFIQRHIVESNEFFEEVILRDLDKYIKDNAIILDIGANIGNHTLYWLLASKKKIERVHSFEPVLDTFNILVKNIEINNLSGKVKLYNIGLNDCSANATCSTYRRQNIGDTHLKVGEGNIILKSLDSIDLNEERIDFLKIDVEDMEIPMLKGSVNTLKKYKPVIFIESQYKNINEVKNILENIGYSLIKEYHQNILYNK